MNDGREFEGLIIAESADIYCTKYFDEEECTLKIRSIRREDVHSITRNPDHEIAKRELEDSWNERIKNNCVGIPDGLPAPEPQPDIVETEKTSEEYCSLDITCLDALFTAQRLTGSQQEETWEEYRGKKVTWTGEVRWVRETFGAVVVGFRHEENDRTFYVEAVFPNDMNEGLLRLRRGQVAVYTGKIVGRRSFSTHWEVGDAIIIQTRDQ